MTENIEEKVIDLYMSEQVTEDIIARRLHISEERVVAIIDNHFAALDEDTEA